MEDYNQEKVFKLQFDTRSRQSNPRYRNGKKDKSYRMNKQTKGRQDFKFGFTSAESDSTDESQAHSSVNPSLLGKDMMLQHKAKGDNVGEAAANIREYQRQEQEMRQTRLGTKRNKS